MALDAMADVLASADKERKAINFVNNLKGALKGPVAALLSHRGEEGDERRRAASPAAGLLLSS